MKKVLVLVLVLASMVPFLGFAQEDSTDASSEKVVKPINKIVGFDVGFVTGYSLATEGMVVGRDFGINFTLSPSIVVGFRSVTGLVADSVLLDLSYFVIPSLALDLLVGSDGTNTVAGLDVDYYLLKSKPDEVLSSSLKIKVGYLFDSGAGIASGTVALGIIGSIGY